MAVDEQALSESIDGLIHSLAALAEPSVQPTAAYLAEIVAAAADLLDVDSVGIMLLDDAGVLRAAASTSEAAAQLEQAQQRLGLGPGHDSTRRRGTVLVEDLAAEPAYAALAAELAPLRLGAVLSAPIWVERDVLGNLNLIRADVHHWSEQEARAAAAYAEVVGKVLGISAWSAGPVPDGRTPPNGRRHTTPGSERHAN
jgi:GAF domain-containing protein